jgi:hypothetical protein
VDDLRQRDDVWHRMMGAVRMRQAGLTFRAIGDRLGVGPTRAQQIVNRGNRMVRYGLIMPPSMRINLKGLAREVRNEYHRLTGVWL